MKTSLAVITGATGGIGSAIAEYFLRKHYRILLIGRSSKRLIKLKDKLQAVSSGAFIDYRAVDFLDSESVLALSENICSEFDSIDVLFNNTGIVYRKESSLDLASFEAQMMVNMISTFAFSKPIINCMKQQKSGYILNMSSIAGRVGIGQVGGYCASKFAMNGWSDSLFEELKPYNVKVTALCPGSVNVGMSKDNGVPDERKILINDVAQSVDYLLSLSNNAAIKQLDLRCIFEPY